MAFDLKTGAQKARLSLPRARLGLQRHHRRPGRDGLRHRHAQRPDLRTEARGQGAGAVRRATPRLKGIDGIVFGGDGKLYLNIVSKGQLMRVDRGPDGAMTGLTELEPVPARGRARRLPADRREALPAGRGQQRADRRGDIDGDTPTSRC